MNIVKPIEPFKNPNPNLWKWVVAVLLIVLAIVVFTSCYTPKKAGEQIDKALNKYPEIAAKKIRDSFPCVDGVVKPGDSTGYFKLMDSLDAINDFYNNLLNNIEPETIVTKDLSDSMKVIVLTDNLRKCNERYALREKQLSELKTKIAKPVFIHDTIPVKDMADVFLARVETDKVIKANEKLKAQNDTLQHKLHNRSKQALWLLILCIGLLVWTFRKLFI